MPVKDLEKVTKKKPVHKKKPEKPVEWVVVLDGKSVHVSPWCVSCTLSRCFNKSHLEIEHHLEEALNKGSSVVEKYPDRDIAETKSEEANGNRVCYPFPPKTFRPEHG